MELGDSIEAKVRDVDNQKHVLSIHTSCFPIDQTIEADRICYNTAWRCSLRFDRRYQRAAAEWSPRKSSSPEGFRVEPHHRVFSNDAPAEELDSVSPIQN
jgi:hypothetical protein